MKPIAHIRCDLKTKFGRRRPALIIGLIPMILAYVLFTLVSAACHEEIRCTFLEPLPFFTKIFIFAIQERINFAISGD